MQIIRLSQFKRMWKKLPADVQARAAKAIRLLAADRSHPSLGLKRLQRLPQYLEVRIDRDHRLICQMGSEVIVLVAVGRHEVLGRVRQK
ncbi:MAG: hypothetical protein FJY67_00155 [Calditrichaeota bacterium]|nr:hypothetical protein [Calditrichota bacterium]